MSEVEIYLNDSKWKRLKRAIIKIAHAIRAGIRAFGRALKMVPIFLFERARAIVNPDRPTFLSDLFGSLLPFTFLFAVVLCAVNWDVAIWNWHYEGRAWIFIPAAILAFVYALVKALNRET